MTARVHLAVVAALALVAGCRQDPTELVLVVDTDLVAPDELDNVQIDVTGTTGASAYSRNVALGTAGASTLPLGLTLSHPGGPPLMPVTIAVVAQKGTMSVLRRDVVTEFVAGRTKLLRIVLARACLGRACAADMSCAEGTCAPNHVFASGLPDFVAIPPRYDAGTFGDGCRPEVCNGLDDDCDGHVDNGFDLMTEPGNCGACGNDCRTKPGVATAHCMSGVCTVDTCMPSRGDCSGGGADGCETDTSTDAAHCGACTTPCSTNHATPTCSGGACRLACTPGFGDCDTASMGVANGCEADLTDIHSCGRCLHMCALMCTGGYCDDDVVVEVVTGGSHSCARRRSGVVTCWGANGSGRLGDGTTTMHSAPVDARGITNAVAIAAGDQHTCAVLADHTVACWGAGANGRLGRGSTTDSSTPVAVTGVSDAVAIAAGLAHTCVVRSGGGVKCWGRNGSGQLGNGMMVDALLPVDVGTGASAITDATHVAAGQTHTCVVRSGGGVKCWGLSDHGQIGQLTPFLPSSSLPVDVPNVMGIVAIASSPGANHTCGMDGAGVVTCWGQGTDGELGDGTLVDRGSVGTAVTLPMAASAIGGGATHACAVLMDGTARCWGGNDHGQLGDGTTLNHPMGVVVTGGAMLAGLAGGNGHTCALGALGAVTCWGWNLSGQLGDGTTTDRPTSGGVRSLPF